MTIEDFPRYDVSDQGHVINNTTSRVLRTSRTPFGHVKVNLISDTDGLQYTRSVAVLVARAFVEPPNENCTHVVPLDGNLENLRASNLVWLTPRYAYMYSRQLKTVQPVHFHNLPVTNITTGDKYDSIIEAGKAEGLLFEDIWDSTYSGERIFPHGHIFRIS